MSHAMVYVTVSERTMADHMAQLVVEEGLAACVNLVGPVQSVYRWEGAMHQEEQWVLWCKTVEACLAPLQQRIADLHPDQCPCIMVVPIIGGRPDFLAWIESQCTASCPIPPGAPGNIIQEGGTA